MWTTGLRMRSRAVCWFQSANFRFVSSCRRSHEKGAPKKSILYVFAQFCFRPIQIWCNVTIPCVIPGIPTGQKMGFYCNSNIFEKEKSKRGSRHGLSSWLAYHDDTEVKEAAEFRWWGPFWLGLQRAAFEASKICLNWYSRESRQWRLFQVRTPISF